MLTRRSPLPEHYALAYARASAFVGGLLYPLLPPLHPIYLPRPGLADHRDVQHHAREVAGIRQRDPDRRGVAGRSSQRGGRGIRPALVVVLRIEEIVRVVLLISFRA